ncbi:MAG TPA: threonine--tRNA ligase [Candidatus Dormibacteraeota bacterium]|jgi:threonyl-tRNA synthetase|nr:threonine--tRNA ligase [Candidatus Dormibacteraeota bacterium]
MADDLVDDAAEAGPPLEAPESPTLDILRHSAAHLMAAAVVDLFPGAQYDVGPAIQDGFFYNFQLPDGATFSETDLAAVEGRMRELAKRRLPFEREVLSRDDARALFTELGQPFKVDIIDRMDDSVDTVGIYRTGDFVDLCRGPHVADTGRLRAIRLLRVAGVYWRGDERNPQLQRIYGTAWFTRDELEAYLERLAEAEKRDHRRLGRELDLFSVSEELGGGLVLWHPRGGLVRGLIEDHWRDAHRRGGYEQVFSPHIAQRSLWETSKHVDFYADSMYSPMDVDGRPFQLKPMNCPFHILIYKSSMRSYRELPVRYAELGTVYRYERSGVLHGLLRVRGFTQDDAHIFCRPDQIEEEIGTVIDFSMEMFRTFGFEEVSIYLSTKPEKAIGSDEQWHAAEAALEGQLRKRGIDIVVNPGDGAFYGPKIDMKVLDALGREWQCATIQFDFTQPENFGLEYIGEDGERHRPVMVHRALLGSMERFFGVLVEHYAGHFPLWLAPVQCTVIPVQDDVPEVVELAASIAARMAGAGLRSEVSAKSGERLGARIRGAKLGRVPYIVVVGSKDVERGDGVVTVEDARRGGKEDISVDALVARLRAEVEEKRPR